MKMVTSFTNDSGNSLFEWRVKATGLWRPRSEHAGFSKMKQRSQHSSAANFAVGRNIGSDNRRKDDALFTGARSKDIKPPLSTFARNRSEIEERPRLIRRHTVANRNKDDVPLVALDSFQILYEKSFAFRGECFNLGPNSKLVDHVINAVALMGGKTSDPKGLIGTILYVASNCLCYLFGLNKIARRSSPVIMSSRGGDQGQSEFGGLDKGTWREQKAPRITLLVR
jgi:hypothetical protein